MTSLCVFLCLQISLDMTQYNSTWYQLVTDYWFFRPGGAELTSGQVSTPNWSPFGLTFNTFGTLYPDAWGENSVSGCRGSSAAWASTVGSRARPIPC